MHKGAKFELRKVTLPPLSATMVQVQMHMVGLCHTDIHMRDNDWGTSDYPLLAGHEGVGVVTHTGGAVRMVNVGDRVGIAWIRDACLRCSRCHEGRENLCAEGYQGTYLGKAAGVWGKGDRYNEHGGCFARVQRIEERFAVRIPDALGDDACPLLCGGATMYEPLCNYAGPGARVGVLGFGGLGRCGLKLAKLRGCHVVVLSSSRSKRDAAFGAGADEFWLLPDDSDSDANLATGKKALDLIIDTRPVNASVEKAVKLLAFNGVFCRVGIPAAANQNYTMPWIPQIFTQQSVTGSVVTGTKRLNDLMILAAENVAFIEQGLDSLGVEVIPFDQVNDAMHKLHTRQNKCFRYVLEW